MVGLNTGTTLSPTALQPLAAWGSASPSTSSRATFTWAARVPLAWASPSAMVP